MRKNILKYFPRNTIKAECKRLEETHKKRGHELGSQLGSGPECPTDSIQEHLWQWEVPVTNL
jgi:hypothetical protein